MCRSDNQCQPWESCQKVSEEGRRACLSWRDDDEDQCATNSDCKAKGTVKTVCKEQAAGQRKCVEPGLCQSRCSKDEICDQDDRCRAQPECKTDSDCGKAGQWICRKFSAYGTKTCVLDPHRKLSEDLVVATESKVVRCSSNEDCATPIMPFPTFTFTFFFIFPLSLSQVRLK